VAIQTQGRAVITPLGINYNTSMTRPDAALAVTALYSAATRGQLRVGSICVTGSGLSSAIFCEIVARFYQPRAGGSNSNFPIGFATDAAAPDLPMVKAAVDRKKDDGTPQYARTITRVVETSLPEALMRNGITLTTRGAIVLSAPATSLAKSLSLGGSRELYKERIQRLILVDTGAVRQDAAALAKLLAEWPTPVYLIGPEVGSALQFPGAKLDTHFGWSPAHPAADAYRAFKAMPYDAPLYDLAAVHFAVTPDANYFVESAPGTLSVGSDGLLKFAPGAGQARKVSIDPAGKTAALDAMIAMAATQPTPSPLRGRGAGA
jgi:hypothetical protein